MRTEIMPIGLLALALAGCAARLNVKVDVYDGPVPVTVAEARDAARTVLADPFFDAAARAQAYESFMAGFRRQLQEAFVPQSMDATVFGIVWESRGTGIAPLTQSAWAPVDEAAGLVRAAAGELDLLLGLQPNGELGELERQEYGELAGALVGLSGTFNTFQAQFEAAFKAHLEPHLSPQQIRAQLARAKAETPGAKSRTIASSGDLDGRAVGYPLFDPLIARIIQNGQDNPEHWVPFVRNEFKTQAGNAQFVVVSEGLLVYHQKSLDFDPTPVIGAGKATGKLGLKLGAALASGMTSVPVPAAVGGDGQAAPSGEIPTRQLVDLAAMKADQQLLRQRQEAKLFLLRQLADLHEEAAAGGIDRQDWMARLREAVGFYQGRIGLVSGRNEP